ncbi:MAG: S-adenosylmethionine decarboxylase [Candidatus Taylorbacteria bacterium]
MEQEHFGEHLTIDGYGGSRELLNSKDLVLGSLSAIPKLLKMEVLSEPQVFFAPENDVKDPGGWSGFVIIAESHVSIHTFPKRGFISADVYTCKNGLEKKIIEDYFKKTFELKDLETNFLIRGKKYPPENIY